MNRSEGLCPVGIGAVLMVTRNCEIGLMAIPNPQHTGESSCLEPNGTDQTSHSGSHAPTHPGARLVHAAALEAIAGVADG